MYGFLFPQAELRYLNTDNFISYDWGGGRFNPPPFFVKTKEKVIRFCTVFIFFLSGSFEDMGIFTYFNLVLLGGGGYNR